jgi:uncharacterized membrane protein
LPYRRKDAAYLKERGVGFIFIVSSLARINEFVLRDYFTQQLLLSQHAPEAQQAASQTHGPPASHAQPSSAQAQFAHTQAAPQQQLASAFALPKEVAANTPATARTTNATKPRMTDFISKLQENIDQKKKHGRATSRCALPELQLRQMQ